MLDKGKKQKINNKIIKIIKIIIKLIIKKMNIHKTIFLIFQKKTIIQIQVVVFQAKIQEEIILI